MAGWEIAAMVLVIVAGLEVLLVGELPVNDMPKLVYGMINNGVLEC